MRTCGECAWYVTGGIRDGWGICRVPLPWWTEEVIEVFKPIEVAGKTEEPCPCFKARVCDRCQNSGWVVHDGKAGCPEWIPCPACQGNNAACRGKEEL